MLKEKENKERQVKMSKTKKDIFICGFCKHHDSDINYCSAKGEYGIYEEDTCDGWEGENPEDEPDFDLEHHDKKCEEKQ